MKLFFRFLGEDKPGASSVIILHGLFGSADNWQSVGKVLAAHRKVYLVDQRNHGSSPHSDQFSYSLMAEDLSQFMQELGLNKAHLIGHSMGGKTVMHFACKYPEKVETLTVVDIAPRYYLPHHQQILQGFRSVKLNAIQTRPEADQMMASVISSPAIRQFLLKNLTRDEGGYLWKHNLDVIEKNIESVGAELPEHFRFEGNSLFIAGSKSDYIQDSDHEKILRQFPQARIDTIQGAGHWVHAEQPQMLIDTIEDFWRSKS